jgi:hypothetical protein
MTKTAWQTVTGRPKFETGDELREAEEFTIDILPDLSEIPG